MKFFVDTAVISEIKELNDLGLVDGVTTNPSLIAKSGGNFIETIKEIAKIVKGPVSAEVVSMDYENMVKEADKLAAISNNICVKLPLTLDGLKTCKYLSKKGVKTNVTLCFSAAQALMAAKAGATYVSPFVGRLDDIGYNGIDLIKDIQEIFNQYEDIKTEIIVASIRNPMHLIDSAKVGADVATIPTSVFKQLVKHPLTDQGLAKFTADWDAIDASLKKF